MGPCTSKPSVAGSPGRYACPPQSRPRHLSRRRHRAGNRLLLRPDALREALPSPTRRFASLQPQGSPNWQWAGRSAHEGFGGWQEYQGDYHGLVPDWHGALSCASPAAPVDTCSPLAEREQIFCVTGFWLQRRDPPLELDRKAVPCGLPIADQLRARRDRPRSTPRCGGHFRHP